MVIAQEAAHIVGRVCHAKLEPKHFVDGCKLGVFEEILEHLCVHFSWAHVAYYSCDIAVCCSVLQCVAVCCGALQYVAE